MVFPYIGNVRYPYERTDQQQRFKSKRKSSSGKDCVTFHRTNAFHCCHSLDSLRTADVSPRSSPLRDRSLSGSKRGETSAVRRLLFECFHEAARSFHFLVVFLDQHFLESTIQYRTGERSSRLRLFFRAFLLSLERFSLAVFAGVQDVVHLVIFTSILNEKQHFLFTISFSGSALAFQNQCHLISQYVLDPGLETYTFIL